jgi:hypothetical protein
MEVEPIVSEVENVAASDTDNAKPADEGAGDAATHSERLKRRHRHKKLARTNSKEGQGVSTPTPLPRYRSWKNSRRPRNGHGRGLPKKGNQIYLQT